MTESRIPKRAKEYTRGGHTGEFIVLRVLNREGVAELGLTGADSVRYRIPFSVSHLIGEDLNQAAVRIEEEVTEKL